MTGSTVQLGVSAAMREVKDDITLAARCDAGVLISGETGVGKGVIARLIHESGPRALAHLVPVACDGVSEAALRAELFGQVPDSASRSQDRRRGAFESADRGTVFLDEIGEMSLKVQARLLHFITTREIRPAGSDRPLPPLDVRVIASTRHPLGERIAAKRFREELFYRLNVVHIAVPPLRERREDVPVLFNEYLRQFAGRAGRWPPELTPEAWGHLTDYSWPCNVRELRNAAERLVQGCRGARADVNDLPEEIALHRDGPHGPDCSRPAPIQSRLAEGLIGARVAFGSVGRGSFRAQEFTRDVLRQLERLGFECARVH